MRKTIFVAAILVLAGASAAVCAQQTQPPPQPQQKESVAEAARKSREQKKSAAKPAKVYTNDDFSKSPAGVSVVGAPPAAAPETDKPAKTAVAKEAKPKSPEGEAGWRAAFARAREQLRRDQSALSILQRELSQLEVQYYPDPMKAMEQQYSRKDINDKRDKIAAKQKDIEQDQQAIADLEDQLRRAGGDPGWARE